MSDTKISVLPSASALTGAERLPVSQSNQTRGATVTQVATEVVTVATAFTQSGTGATSRTVQAKERDFVSVRDFGALGDDSTDDTAAFDAAIAAHDFVYVPAGTYRLTSLASFRSRNLCIWGAGRQSLLKFNTTGKGITAGPWVAGGQQYTFVLSNLAFDNITNTPSAFISQEFYVNSLFDRLYFSDCAATYCIDQVSGYGTKIRDCVFSDVTGGAIRLRDNGASPNYSYVATIDGCDITRPSGIGIEVEAAICLVVSNTIIEGCGGKGIVTSTNSSGLSSEIKIFSCYLEGNTGTDIDLGTDGGSYWGRALIEATFFNQTAVVALGAKSKCTFIGIQGTGGSALTVTGSANAEAWFLGCEMGNITQSGAFKWVDLSSRTIPYILAQSAAASSNGATTNEETRATITVPANALGPNGSLRITTLWTTTNGADDKTLRVRFSGASGTQYLTVIITTNESYKSIIWIQNRNATNSQVGQAAASGGLGAGGTVTTSAVDTTAATTVVITGQKETSGDVLTLESYIVELFPGPV